MPFSRAQAVNVRFDGNIQAVLGYVEDRGNPGVARLKGVVGQGALLRSEHSVVQAREGDVWVNRRDGSFVWIWDEIV